MFSNIVTPKVRQVLAVGSSGLLMIAMMSTWGYPAAALPQMEAPDSPIHLSSQQASWFATVTLMMCIPASVVGAAAYEWFGPRRFMLVLTPILCLSTMTMALGSLKSVQDAGIAEIILLTNRVIQGTVVALLNPFISVYSYEICDQNLRGMMTSFVEVWATIGYLLCYIAGCFLSWDKIALVLPLITLVPAFIGLLFSPESPLWLARKGREEEARAILTQVRCTEEEVMLDLDTVRGNLKDKELTCSANLRKMMKKSNIKAVIACSLILAVNQLTGFSVIALYVVHIFNASGVGLDPSRSAVVVGTSRMICSTFASYLLRNLARRPMLIIGNAFTGIASVILGIFFYLQSTGEDVSWLGWLPLLGFIVYMIGYAGAVGPTTWTASVEVLPGSVRSVGFGVGNTNYAITAFLLSKLFLDLQIQIGMHGVFWLFAGGSLCYIALVLLYIPETHGMSPQDIEDYWENPKKNKKDPVYA